MTPEQRLKTLATIADIDPHGLKHALKHSFPDWVPNAEAATVPNAEYTKTREPRWRAVSVLVAKIITNREVSPESIRSLAMQFAAHREEPPKPVSEVVDSDYVEPIAKSDLAKLFGVSPRTIARRIASGELHALPGTSNDAQKVRIHGDDFPSGLKRPHERKKKISETGQ